MIEPVRGITLRRKKDQESDSVVTVLAESGKLYRVRFHGIMQSKTRSTLITEPGTFVDLRVHLRPQGGVLLGSVKEGTLVERFDSWKKGYRALALLSSILEFAEGTAASFDSEDMFRLLLGGLREGEQNPAVFTETGSCIFFNAFRLRALMTAGLMGETGYCSSCGALIKERALWEIPEVSFLCKDCAPDATEEHARLSATTGRLVTEPFSKLTAVRASRESDAGSYLEHVKRLENYVSICVRHALPFPSPAADAFTETTTRVP